MDTDEYFVGRLGSTRNRKESKIPIELLAALAYSYLAIEQ